MSGAVDEDVVRTVASGRETLGAMLSTAQGHLQKAFIVFVIGFLGTFYTLWAFVWTRLKTDLFSKMAPTVREQTMVVATTPFEVILLQVKIGLVVGLLFALPVVVYYSRDALRERGLWPTGVPRWKIAVVALLALGLFAGGIAYAYFLFFPIVFDFLATNAIDAGFQPTYSIVKWAQFTFLLALSFGLAAQLPLAMTALSLTNIVPYETFRDYWKHAIVVLYALGALFTPPDPLTQVMWATPLVLLYAFSLALTKFVVTTRRSSEQIGIRRTLLARWTQVVGAALLVGVLAYAAAEYLPRSRYVPAAVARALSGDVYFLPHEVAVVLFAAVAALVAAAAMLVRALFAALDELDTATAEPATADTGTERTGQAAETADTGAASVGAPADIDLAQLDAAGVRAAPDEAFRALSEDEAVALASDAMEADAPEKAQAIFDRFDAVQETTEASESDAAEGDTAESDAAPAAAAQAADPMAPEPHPEPERQAETGGFGGILSRRGAGMLDAFTEDETTEDDIGGYAYDLAFIFDSLTSKAFRLVGLFMVVLAVVFGFLYTGGIGAIKRDFLSRLPNAVTPDQVNLVALHPVEALIFEIKVATIVAAAATFPLVLYYAWPALKERGFVRGSRGKLFGISGTLFVALVAGSLVGYGFVAPDVISWLAADAIRANMIIAYRINNFGWLVFFTTVGVGLLADIPVGMVLVHRAGMASYRTLRGRWREVTIAVFAVAALFTPKGVFTMFLFGIPFMAAYGLGLAILWVYTFGGRRDR